MLQILIVIKILIFWRDRDVLFYKYHGHGRFWYWSRQMCNSQHLWKAQWSRYSKCESVKNNYHLLLHGQSTDSEWEAKRESVKHNLRLLLDRVSVFKGQTLKNRCHCFQTVICIKEVYRTMWVLDSKTLRCCRFPTHLSVGDKRAHFGCDVWSGLALTASSNLYIMHINNIKDGLW